MKMLAFDAELCTLLSEANYGSVYEFSLYDCPDLLKGTNHIDAIRKVAQVLQSTGNDAYGVFRYYTSGGNEIVPSTHNFQDFTTVFERIVYVSVNERFVAVWVDSITLQYSPDNVKSYAMFDYDAVTFISDTTSPDVVDSYHITPSTLDERTYIIPIQLLDELY